MAHRRPHSGRLTDPLTEREREILACLAEGVTNQEIANRLHLAEKTVRWYNSRIYSKLGVHNRAEAVAQAKALSLLTVSDSGLVAGKHNLPEQFTLFVGRHQEMSELAHLLSNVDTRLITILGAGGMGKTRLALEVARVHLSRFADGVYFVPLAPLSSAEHIVTTIAERVGLQFHDEAPPQAQLLGFFARKQMLLVLDNFEHLLDGALLVTEILRAALQVKILVTSREKLNLSGETVFTLAGLGFPDWETPEDALEYDAVTLLLQSAHRVRPDFALRSNDLAHLARICQLTAGMPLALVLAACWVNTLTLEQIAAEIKQGIDILETEMRDVPDRQRSVRSTFYYTWSRLNDAERDVFMKVSVFRGGFTTEAAQAVAGASLHYLRKLIDKALVQTSPAGRYNVHELLRKYAEEQLEVSGEADATRDAHSAYYLHLVRERETDIKGRRQRAALDEIEADFENVRTAWYRALERMDREGIGDAVEALAVFTDLRSRWKDRDDLFLRAINRLAAQPNEAPHPVWGKTIVRGPIGDEAMAQTRLALDIARQQQDTAETAHCLARMAFLASLTAVDQTAIHLVEESLACFREVGDDFHIAKALASAGMFYRLRGEHKLAFEYLQQSLELQRAMGNSVDMAHTVAELGSTMLVMGNLDEAEQHRRDAYVMAKEERAWVAPSHSVDIGCIFALGKRGNIQEARSLVKEGLITLHETVWPQVARVPQAMALNALSLIDCMSGDYATARTLGEEARSLASGDAWEPMYRWGLLAATCGQCDYTAATEHTRFLLHHFFDKRVNTWLLVGVVFAAILAAYRDHSAARATELLALAFSHPHSLTGWLYVWSFITELQQHLKTELGKEAFNAAWVRGTRSDLEAVARDLLVEYRE
jgi:predicted ATPase/DNA-binding CsgD family transcriptional regulator